MAYVSEKQKNPALSSEEGDQLPEPSYVSVFAAVSEELRGLGGGGEIARRGGQQGERTGPLPDGGDEPPAEPRRLGEGGARAGGHRHERRQVGWAEPPLDGQRRRDALQVAAQIS